jgi:predicted Holliday junction resolvase-like endonuclease
LARIFVYYLFVFLVLTCSTLSNAAQDDKKAKDKSVTSTIANDIKEIKNEFNETKEAIVRDVKALKEQVPKDIKEVKLEFIKKSSEVKASTTQEHKEIREGLSKPLMPAKPEKNN